MAYQGLNPFFIQPAELGDPITQSASFAGKSIADLEVARSEQALRSNLASQQMQADREQARMAAEQAELDRRAQAQAQDKQLAMQREERLAKEKFAEQELQRTRDMERLQLEIEKGRLEDEAAARDQLLEMQKGQQKNALNLMIAQLLSQKSQDTNSVQFDKVFDGLERVQGQYAAVREAAQNAVGDVSKSLIKTMIRSETATKKDRIGELRKFSSTVDDFAKTVASSGVFNEIAPGNPGAAADKFAEYFSVLRTMAEANRGDGDGQTSQITEALKQKAKQLHNELSNMSNPVAVQGLINGLVASLESVDGSIEGGEGLKGRKLETFKEMTGEIVSALRMHSVASSGFGNMTDFPLNEMARSILKFGADAQFSDEEIDKLVEMSGGSFTEKDLREITRGVTSTEEPLSPVLETLRESADALGNPTQRTRSRAAEAIGRGIGRL